MQQAIEFGINRNFIVENNDLGKDLSRLTLRYQRIGLFAPNVTIEGTYNFIDTIEQRSHSDGTTEIQEPDPDFSFSNYKEGELAIVIDDINIFNSFDDWRNLQINSLTNDSTLIQLNQSSLQFFLDLIESYYVAYVAEVKLKNAKQQLKIAESLYDLAKTAQKIKYQKELDVNYLQSSLFEAQGLHSVAKITHREAIRSLEIFINSNIDENTSLTTDLSIQQKSLDLDRLMAKVRTAPTVRQAQKDAKIADLSLRNTQLSIAPKLSMSISGARFGRRRNGDGTEFPVRSYGGFGNINYTAAINLTIPIFGGDTGLFNSVALKTAKLDAKQFNDLYQQEKRNIRNLVKEKYFSIKQREESLRFSQKRLEADSSLLTKITQAYTRGKVNRDELREALNRNFLSLDNNLDEKLDYLIQRKELASGLGDISHLGVNLKGAILKTIFSKTKN